MNVFNLYGDVDVRTNGASSTLNSLQSQANKVGTAFKNMGSKISAAGTSLLKYTTIPIAAALGYSIKAASDLNETMSKTEVVFGKNSDKVKAWSTTTLDSFGLAQGTALDMAAVYGDMGTAMGLSIDKATDMSMSITGLAGDMASFKNMRPDEIHTALSGIFTGETESLKRLGIVMTETNLIEYAKQQGIKKSIKDMSQAEKVQLRYKYVMDASKNSIGDFKRTQDSAANQMRITTESLKELAANIGMILLPTVTKIVKWVNKWIEKFRELPTSVQGIIVKIALFVGLIAPALIVIGGLVSVLGSVITVVSALSFEVVAIAAILGTFLALVAGVIVKTGLWRDIWEQLKIKGALLLDLLTQIWTGLQNGVDPITTIVMWFQKLVGGSSELGLKIGALYASWKVFTTNVKELMNDLWVKFQEAWAAIWDVVKPFFDKLIEEALPIFISLVDELLLLLGELVANFKKNLDILWEAWKKVWKVLKPYVEEALDAVIIIVKNGLKILKDVVKFLRAALKGDWKGMWDSIKSITKTARTAVVEIAKNMGTAFKNQVKSLVSKAVNAMKQLKPKMLAKVNAIKQSMYNAGKNLMSMFIKGISSKISSLVNTLSNAAGKVKDYLGFSSPTKEGAGKTGDRWAPNLMKMYRDGIIKGLPAIQAAVAKVSEGVSSGLAINAGETTINSSVTAAKTAEAKKIELIINNPKFFDYNDVNKFMNPIVTRLKQLGYKGG